MLVKLADQVLMVLVFVLDVYFTVHILRSHVFLLVLLVPEEACNFCGTPCSSFIVRMFDEAEE